MTIESRWLSLRRGGVLAVMSIASALFVCTVMFASAQSATPSTWVTPRTPWGDPDLQGVWPGTAMMGVPIERPRQLGDRAVLSEEEFATRQNQARAQAQADREEVTAPARGRGVGTGPPGHWGERGQPQRQPRWWLNLAMEEFHQ